MSYYDFVRRGVNLDGTFRCPLMCPNCARQFLFTDHGKKVPGKDITREDFKKVLNYFKEINFEGQLSDPVHHPNFIEMIELCLKNDVGVHVQHASAAKPFDWYIKAFKANPKAMWRFSIDGLPETSKEYRIYQNGPKLFKIMKESVKHLENKPTWQYIVFNYNENDIDEAMKLANEIGDNFYLLQSSRWMGPNDPYMPSAKWLLKEK